MQEGFNRYRKISTKVQTRCLQRSVSNFFLSSELLLSKNSNPLFQASLQRMSALTCNAKEMHFQALGASKETIKSETTVKGWLGCCQRPHLWVVQAFPEGEAGAVVALRVDVGQDGHEEGGRLLLGDQLPAAGLTELQAGNRKQKQGAWNGHGGGFTAR